MLIENNLKFLSWQDEVIQKQMNKHPLRAYKGKKEAPPPPAYVAPKKVEEVALNPQEQLFREQASRRLSGQDTSFNEQLLAQQPAFEESLRLQSAKAYDPLVQSALENINRRLGGVNTSLTADLVGKIRGEQGAAETQALSDYILGQPQRQLDIENSLINQLNALAGREAQGYQTGLSLSTPLNAFNQGIYSTQVAQSNLADALKQQQLNSLLNAGIQAGTGIGGAILSRLPKKRLPKKG